GRFNSSKPASAGGRGPTLGWPCLSPAEAGSKKKGPAFPRLKPWATVLAPLVPTMLTTTAAARSANTSSYARKSYDPLGRGDVRSHHLLRLAQCDGEGLEDRLRGVVSVAAADQVDVDVAGALVREGLEELLDQGERKVLVDE